MYPQICGTLSWLYVTLNYTKSRGKFKFIRHNKVHNIKVALNRILLLVCENIAHL